MQVVEHEDQRFRGCERLQQLPDRAVHSVPVAAGGRAVGGGLERREDAREVGERLGLEGIQPPLLQCLEVLVERVDEHPERQVRLQLRAAAGEHDVAERVAAAGKLAEQARLPHSRLAAELQRTKLPPLEVGERISDHAEFSGTPDELVGRLGHRESRPA